MALFGWVLALLLSLRVAIMLYAAKHSPVLMMRLRQGPASDFALCQVSGVHPLGMAIILGFLEGRNVIQKTKEGVYVLSRSLEHERHNREPPR